MEKECVNERGEGGRKLIWEKGGKRSRTKDDENGPLKEGTEKDERGFL